MPLNAMDAHFDSFEKKVVPVALQHQRGILGMKPMGDHIVLESKTVTPVECLHYAMNLPTSVVITGIDSLKILGQALEAARTFHKMNEAEVAALLAKTATAAKNGQYELYKTSHFRRHVPQPRVAGAGSIGGSEHHTWHCCCRITPHALLTQD